MTEFSLQRDTLELIQETARKASGSKDKVTILDAPDEPEGVYYLIDANGKAERKIADPEPRNHKLHSLDQVGPFVDHCPGDPVVWYSEDLVVVIVDDDTRRDRTTLQFQKTPQLKTLSYLEQEKPLRFDQATFIRMLRVDLKGCFPDKRLLSAVRDCKFTANSSVGGQIQHGKVSLGRDIEAEAVSGAADNLPEEVELSVRIFEDPFLRDTWPINCAVEIHTQEAKFELVPFPLVLRNAIDMELDVVGKFLEENCPEETPIFRGTP